MRNALPTLRWAVGGILVLGILARVLGVAREMMVAGFFGTGEMLDTVYLALALPVALCVGLGGGLSRAVVPVGARLSGAGLGHLVLHSGRRLLIGLVVLGVILSIGAPVWTSLLLLNGASVDRVALHLAAGLACLAIPGGAIAGLCLGAANAHGRHVLAYSTPIVYNLVVVICLVAGYRTFGAFSLLLGILAAEWCQTLVLLPFLLGLRRDLAEGDLMEKRPGWPDLSPLFWPSAFLGLSAGLMTTVDRVFAGSVGPGAVSTLSYAERLLYLPVGLLGMALAQPLYTRLSHYAGRERRESFLSAVELGLRLFLLFGTLGALLVSGFAEAIISLLLERGAFTGQDTRQAAEALRGFGPAIVFLAMQPLLFSAAMVLRKAWKLVWLSLGAALLNAVLDALLAPRFGVLGISLATSAVSGIVIVLLIGMTAPELFARRGLWRCARTAALAALFGAVILVVYRQLLPFPGAQPVMQLFWMTGGTLVLLAGLALFPGWLVFREWRSLGILRSTVARDVDRTGGGES